MQSETYTYLQTHNMVISYFVGHPQEEKRLKVINELLLFGI